MAEETTVATPVVETTAGAVTSGPDAALARWRSTDPAKATDAAPAVTTDAAVVTEPAAADDVEALLGESKPVDTAAVDPLEALKDNPRVVELVAAETELKGFKESLADLPYAVATPEDLKGQVTDAHALYDVVTGKAKASTLLDMMLQNPHWSDAQKQEVLSDLAQDIAKRTGKPIATSAAGIEDPAMAKLTALEKQIADRDQKEARTKLEQRMADGRTKASKQLEALTKGTFLEGEDVLPELGKLLGGKEQQVLEGIEKGDFKLVEEAFAKFRKQEVDRFKRYNQRLIAMKKAKDAALPKNAGGGRPIGSADANKIDLTDQKTRLDYATKQFRGETQ